MAAGQQSVSPQQQAQSNNLLARQFVIANSIDSIQQIYSQVLSGTIMGQVVNVPLRNTGLIKRLYVKVSFTLVQAASETLTLQTLGSSNIFSQVVLTDLNNQTRINTSGWHLQAVASAKRGFPFGSSIGTNSAAGTDNPFGYGDNYQKVQTAPATITTVQTIYAIFEVPLAYSDDDLRGALYGSVVNATMNLQLTVNPALVVGSGAADATLSMYKSSTAGDVGTIGTFTITVFQNYLDQIPMGPKGPILPALDLSTAYLLNNTTLSGLVANQDNPIPYANFRDFLSTFVIYDNAGTLNAGTDINYWALQSANFTNLFKYDPNFAALMTRLRLRLDVPKAMTYFDHRSKPINSIQYGNMALILNPLTVTSSATTALIGYEMMALINQVTQAGSLYGN